MVTTVQYISLFIFSSGGVGDMFLMYNDLLSRYGNDIKFVGVGYSLGACILLRFLRECKEAQSKFVCGFSFCQGYCPIT